MKLGSNVRKAGATGHPKGQLWLLLPGHTRPGSSSCSGLTPALAVLEEVLQVKLVSDLWGMSRRGCPGLCAEFLSQPSSSAVCPYNPVNTVVRGKFISLKAAFLSPLSLLVWFWFFCKANLERALSFQTGTHTHTLSLSTCATRAVLYKGCSITSDYRTVVENDHVCFFPPHPKRFSHSVGNWKRFFFKDWMLLSLLEE